MNPSAYTAMGSWIYLPSILDALMQVSVFVVVLFTYLFPRSPFSMDN